MTPQQSARSASEASRAVAVACLVLTTLLCACGGAKPRTDASPADEAELVRHHRARIEALRHGAAGDDASTTAPPPGTDAAPAEEAPAAEADGEGDPCQDVCAPADGICESTAVICEVASFNPSRAEFRADCQWALSACEEAREHCEACQ